MKLTTGRQGQTLDRELQVLLHRATQVDILVAFAQRSGVEWLLDPLVALLHRENTSVRVLAGDYCDVTDPEALHLLLDLAANHPNLSTRMIEVAKLPGESVSFHPKAWRIEGLDFGYVFVGSSNLSKTALISGVEWNLGFDRAENPDVFESAQREFEQLWALATRIDRLWVARYSARRILDALIVVRDIEPEPPSEAPPPHLVQQEALAALRAARDHGQFRALVVLATGLGKTMLAAFDYAAMRVLRPTARLLFVAHREEILLQAASTLRCVIPNVAHLTFCAGGSADLNGTIAFASIQKLSRGRPLEDLRRQRFDYVVIDEVHHAAAATYATVMAALGSAFTLGLTATPDRADACDIMHLFGGKELYRANIGRGIEVGQLVPFDYFGVKDTIDFATIPWRNRSFDIEKLAGAAQTEQRMETLWQAWVAHPGARSLVFCCTTEHADFARDWLAQRGVAVAAVHSGVTSDPRAESLRRLTNGEIAALCAVDMFNEGVDVPAIDRVIMLRPTESGVVFLQQLGRGLRACHGKARLTVIDFVGNHRISAEHIRWVISEAVAGPIEQFLAKVGKSGCVDLPDGCAVQLELEAKECLEQWLQGDRKPRTDDGVQLDASFLVQAAVGRLDVVVKSRSGQPQGVGTNTQYASGLLLLLQRLAANRFVVVGAVVDSTEARALPVDERSILAQLPNALIDPVALVSQMSRRMKAVGRPVGAKGQGNATKRIRLTVTHEAKFWTASALADLLETGLVLPDGPAAVPP